VLTQARIYLVFKVVEPFVTMYDLKMTEKCLALLLAPQSSDDLRASGFWNFDECNPTVLQARFDFCVWTAIGRE